jgi:thiamine-monophosphate kinase
LRNGTSLSEIGEFGFIRRIAGRIPAGGGVAVGIGDDAAAVEPAPGRLCLVTSDMMVEGVHFDLSFCDPISLGKKALAVNLSDIAAMGGEPRHFLLSLAVPPSLSLDFLDDCVQGMLQRAEEFGVVLIGGDTCSSPDRMVLSVTVLGDQLAGRIVRRSGARPGDHVCVTGTVGDSALGLDLLRKGTREGPAVTRHLDPAPRVREGRALAEAGIPSAMIDISDGLLADLGHILELSSVGACLHTEKLPLSPHFLERFPVSDQASLAMALAGGEDYELLFTAPPGKIPAARALMDEIGTAVTVIGTITVDRGLAVIGPDGAEFTVQGKGYDHFSALDRTGHPKLRRLRRPCETCP